MAWFRKKKYTTLNKEEGRPPIPSGLIKKCPACLETLVSKVWEDGLNVCPTCGYHDRLGAFERIGQLLDEGSFEERDADLIGGDPLGFVDSKAYPARLEAARENTGMNEAVVCGLGKIQGHEMAVAVMDMSFIGGSMGAVVGEKIARVLERALEEKLPTLLVCCSGGARMQEGIISLMQMAKTASIIAKLHEARLPLITLLADPTTGGVTASFAMLGDVIIAEPNGLIGFAGPRVIEQTIKQILPAGFQRTEFVADHGFVDIVCKRPDLRQTIGTLLAFFLHSSKRSSAKVRTRRGGKPRAASSAAPAKEAPSEA